jgi:hypothetical protein
LAHARSDSRQRSPGERFGRGFRSAGQTARRTLDKVAGKQGFAEPDILLRWAEIAGDAYAGLCRPVKVNYGARRAGGGTLVVQTDSGRAPEVEHLAPKILERVNQFYGYRAVGRLKITQVSYPAASAPTQQAAGFSEPAAPFYHQNDETDARLESESAGLVADIQSDGLRAALTRMGTHVLAQNRKRGATDNNNE